MGIITFLDRQKMFPHIQNLEDLEIEKKVPAKLMSFKKFFYFSPTAYALIHWGLPACFLIQNLVVYNYFKTFGIILLFINAFILLRQILYWKWLKGSSFYEVYMI